MQSPKANRVFDCAFAHPDVSQLIPRHHSVLARCKLRDRKIGGTFR